MIDSYRGYIGLDFNASSEHVTKGFSFNMCLLFRAIGSLELRWRSIAALFCTISSTSVINFFFLQCQGRKCSGTSHPIKTMHTISTLGIHPPSFRPVCFETIQIPFQPLFAMGARFRQHNLYDVPKHLV